MLGIALDLALFPNLMNLLAGWERCPTSIRFWWQVITIFVSTKAFVIPHGRSGPEICVSKMELITFKVSRYRSMALISLGSPGSPFFASWLLTLESKKGGRGFGLCRTTLTF